MLNCMAGGTPPSLNGAEPGRAAGALYRQLVVRTVWIYMGHNGSLPVFWGVAFAHITV